MTKLDLNPVIDKTSIYGFNGNPMSLITERRLEEKERRRNEILEAATAVASIVGFDDMTMDQVARKARLSRALVYVYFQDKNDLLFGICNLALGVLHTRFVEAASRHPRGLEKVEAIGRAYVAFAQEFPVFFDALARFEAHSPDVGRSVEDPASNGTEVAPSHNNEVSCVLGGDRVHDTMVMVIEHGVRDGSIRSDVGPPQLVAVTLWGFMHGIIQLASTKANVLAHDGVSTNELINHALVMARRSLAVKE